ncbi:hypothetical protein R1sor_005103 [Riccia sorocarpa]|uniref:Exocyst complex component Sec6 n=1 Tax=Riccia sorocarpa TaxID=122646 RepID=A0ABD3HM32_9MARC
MELESTGVEGPDAVTSLPDKDAISPFLCDLLNGTFKTVEDLSSTPTLVTRLLAELDTEKEKFRKAQTEVLVTAASSLSRFGLLTKSLRNVNAKIENVRASSVPLFSSEKKRSGNGGGKESSSSSSSRNKKESAKLEKIFNSGLEETVSSRHRMVEELGALAIEVARVEKVRVYAESALKLEQLVGDLEAAVANISVSVPSSAQTGGSLLKLTHAVKTMQTTEAAVAKIANAHWDRLVSSVDVRVDRVAAILRPAVVAAQRSILSSIKWPPPFTAGGGEKLPNPLLEMQEVQERQYVESFMALTILQAVQQARRERQLNRYKQLNEETESERRIRARSIRAPLWAMDELVSPLAAKAEPFLIKWTTKPELAFALALRLGQEFVDVIDDFLQPLIDKANLAGYSAREEWIFSLVNMMSLFLQTHVLPGLANDLQDDGGAGSVAAALMLHIVDQALAFDTRMKSLAARALGLFGGGSVDDSQVEDLDNLSGPVVLSVSAIADREEWLELWARVELEDVLSKLRVELQSDAAWTTKARSEKSLGLVQDVSQGAAVSGLLGATVQDFRAPAGAYVVLSSMSAIADRCRSLLEPSQQYVFVKTGVIPIANEYHEELLRRCQELEAVTALADESSIVTVATCLNAARYCQYTLQEWGEDIFFLELFQSREEEALHDAVEEAVDGAIFSDEVAAFQKFRQEWLSKLVSSVTRGFEARSREYTRNKKKWSEPGRGIKGSDLHAKPEDTAKDLMDDYFIHRLKEFDVSSSLVNTLAVLQSQLSALNAALDYVNFLEFWRSLAGGLDQLLVNSVILSGAKFSEHGGWQVAADVQALFMLFKPYCVRPSGFFKSLHDAVILLTLPSENALVLLDVLQSSPVQSREQVERKQKSVSDTLRHYGVRKLELSTVKRVLSCRLLSKH